MEESKAEAVRADLERRTKAAQLHAELRWLMRLALGRANRWSEAGYHEKAAAARGAADRIAELADQADAEARR
jgi:hypothetical protein